MANGQDETRELGRGRARQIFRFLKDFNGLRNPTKRQIAEQPWVMWLNEVPQHSHVWLRGRDVDPKNTGEPNELLKVRRPDVPPPPALPRVLDGWFPASWRDPSIKAVEPFTERETPGPDNTRVIEKFVTSSDRVRAHAQWKPKREEWAREAVIARQVLGLFNRFYELQGRLEREGESVQLLLGQGVLLWRRDDGDIRHPVITQRLELSFDPYIPQFEIVETDQPAELLRPLLFADQPQAAQTIQQADDELAKADFDLLDSSKMEGPLRRLAAVLHSEGRFLKELPKSAAEFPQFYCDPVIYLTRRTQGFSAALDYILEDLRGNPDLPSGLMRISGIESAPPDVSTTSTRPWEEPPEILFTKEANEEQIQIADRLRRHGDVLVQGPPGTGKTHTIANLIGNLLAQGKRVLVTAHTSKALRVLRDKVVEPLQTLCVSVLDNETESRKQLEASVDAMVARLTSDDPVQLDKEADAAEAQRHRLIAELSRLQQALMAAREDEYRDVTAGDATVSPSEAARFVAANALHDSWITGPVESGVSAPLSDEETTELYGTNARIDCTDETELLRWRPALGDVPGAEEFGRESDRWRMLQEADKTTGSEFWGDSLYDATEEELVRIQTRISASIALLADAPLWKLDAIAAGLSGRTDSAAPWNELIQRVDALCNQAQQSIGLLLDHRCDLGSTLPPEQHRFYAHEIRASLESGGKLTTFRLMARPAWRKFLAVVKVNDREPQSVRDFLAIEVCASLTEARRALGIRWANQITRRGGARWDEFGDRPEEGVVLFTPQVRALLAWHRDQLSPLLDELRQAGFKWDEFLTSQEVVPGEHPELRRLINSVVGPLPQIVAARTNLLNLKLLDRKFQQWHRGLFSVDPNALPASAVLDLRHAADRKDYDAYNQAYRRLAALHSLGPMFERRRLLLDRVRQVAHRWAVAIHERSGPHGAPAPPGSVLIAWKWQQCHQELERRSRVSFAELQEKIRDVRAELRYITTRLIELRSWSAQCRRVGLEERQALQGWKDINRRIGRGTGQRAPGLKVEARRTLARARNAVPVWVMPLSRVAETFDPRVTRFDVVIVDESSQCDVMGLVAIYLAKHAVVVGDHEQVSPLAVGQEISEVERLIEQHLAGIPNSRLYDGKMSLYDLARQSFGGVVRLLEHFRCMPEIIAFSNAVSYNGAIKPLRDPTSTQITPAVVPYRAAGLRSGNKVNREEARTIAALLQAAMELPEYRGKTFGVVSLLGEEQAVEIETLVRQTLPPEQLVASQFLCGTAAQFQGDERDVVFLTLVDSPADGPLPKRDVDLFRQRFNVAASRPKDQLWVVHSLDPRRDLQPGDLRRRLIEHAENPRSLLDEQLGEEAHVESEFERLVLRRLLDAGFRVTPQWPVGRYRIDLVVQGDGRRLAVECDGDRFHPLEKIVDDMARQAVLERLGWRFVRIRGSQFFRDPSAAIVPVFDRLTELGIVPDRETITISGTDSNGLVDRVKQRARQIISAWDGETRNTGETSVISNPP